ncbi:MAG TPA: hypothetical protein PLQ93_00215 [Bacteroidia bacterium]|nr:hypothetical protein [Bacteroidia bacterium]
MKLHLALLAAFLITFTGLIAQEKSDVSNDSLLKSLQLVKKDVDQSKKLKINGWIQAQYQYTDTTGVKNYDGGDFPANVNSRFMLRRARVKFTYTSGLVQYVFQLNATERFVNIADFYGKVSEPWTKWLALQVGMTNRPFGYDIQMSSQYRESPERARYTQVLTPNERDMGAEIIAEAPVGSKLRGLTVTAGFFNGTGLTIPAVNISDIDSKKDFIGRAAYYSHTKNDRIKYGFGFSHYNGYERIANNIYYNSIGSVNGNDLVFKAADTSATSYKDKYAKRVYYGGEALFSFKWPAGTTTLRGEYVFGTQPGSATDSKSPQVPTTGATYFRPFNSSYVFFIQQIGKSKHELVVKYEFYDPNSKVSGNQIDPGKGFTAADIRYHALGLGYNFNMNENCKFMFYYNMVTNETSTKLAGFSRDLPDNIFTARLQVRF